MGRKKTRGKKKKRKVIIKYVFVHTHTRLMCEWCACFVRVDTLAHTSYINAHIIPGTNTLINKV